MNKKLQVLGNLFNGPHPYGVEDCSNCISRLAFCSSSYSSDDGGGGITCENWEYFGLGHIRKLEEND